MNGKGTFKFPDGKSYSGDYYRDKKHGYGCFKWSDAKSYEGWWKDGKQHGYGIIYQEGVAKPATWIDGKRDKWITMDEYKLRSKNFSV